MRKRNREADADEAQIDLTPMLDVVLIMLIFFIVVASFLKEAGIEMNRPDSNQNPPESDATSIVAVSYTHLTLPTIQHWCSSRGWACD